MRILLIMPDAHMHKLRIGSFVRSMRKAPLTLTTLAAMVPSDIEVKLVDGSVDPIRMGWPQLLEDFRRGKLKRVYREHPLPDHVLAEVPPPRRELQRGSGYMLPYTVQATRGCKQVCDFCTVNAVWPHYLKRPIADVIRDIRSIPGRHFSFNDVSLVDDLDYAKEIFTAITPLRKRWGGTGDRGYFAGPGAA